jgi:hypothetical protein
MAENTKTAAMDEATVVPTMKPVVGHELEEET